MVRRRVFTWCPCGCICELIPMKFKVLCLGCGETISWFNKEQAETMTQLVVCSHSLDELLEQLYEFFGAAYR